MGKLRGLGITVLGTMEYVIEVNMEDNGILMNLVTNSNGYWDFIFHLKILYFLLSIFCVIGCEIGEFLQKAHTSVIAIDQLVHGSVDIVE